ncbi:MAG: CvpA family protein [Methylotenera sp.]|nr:CvpA family protein [Methylotenera sp.]
MTSFDYLVLAILGLSVVLSVMRGLVLEALSIVGWVLAFFVAKSYASQLVPMMPEAIPTESLRVMAAFLMVFLATLLISSLLSIALASLFKKLGLGWLNRILGGLFGLTRGIIIVCLLVFLAGMTSLPQDERWRDAMFSAPFEALVGHVLPWVPDSIKLYVKYD